MEMVVNNVRVMCVCACERERDVKIGGDKSWSTVPRGNCSR